MAVRCLHDPRQGTPQFRRAGTGDSMVASPQQSAARQGGGISQSLGSSAADRKARPGRGRITAVVVLRVFCSSARLAAAPPDPRSGRCGWREVQRGCCCAAVSTRALHFAYVAFQRQCRSASRIGPNAAEAAGSLADTAARSGQFGREIGRSFAEVGREIRPEISSITWALSQCVGRLRPTSARDRPNSVRIRFSWGGFRRALLQSGPDIWATQGRRI